MDNKEFTHLYRSPVSKDVRNSPFTSQICFYIKAVFAIHLKIANLTNQNTWCNVICKSQVECFDITEPIPLTVRKYFIWLLGVSCNHHIFTQALSSNENKDGHHVQAKYIN
jgi:hypothetical protein